MLAIKNSLSELCAPNFPAQPGISKNMFLDTKKRCGFSFGEGCNGDSKFNMFGGRKQTTSMVQKLSTVKQVDPKQLQE